MGSKQSSFHRPHDPELPRAFQEKYLRKIDLSNIIVEEIHQRARPLNKSAAPHLSNMAPSNLKMQA